MGRPRILWINQFAVSPGDGGGTRHFEVGRELTKLGWDVTLAASDFHLLRREYMRRRGASHCSVVEESLDGVLFLWLWSAPYARNNWRRGWNWLSFSRALLGLHRRAKWDLVIGSSPHLFAAAASARLATRLGVPFVFEVRDLWPESLLASGGKSGPFSTTLDRLARWLYRRADCIVVLAQGTGDYLVQERQVDPDRIVFVPNGVDPSAFPARADNSRDETVFVYAGAHGPANGLDVVVDAAHRLRDREDLGFRLIGDGPEKPKLVARAEQLNLPNIEFLDPISKSEIPSAFAEADVGLMVLRDAPLFRFGVSPNKLFDYLAASLPVVCNVPGEVEKIVADAGAGISIAPGSSEALAAAAVDIVDRGREWRRDRGRSGRAWVEEKRSRTVLAERLDSRLRGLL